LVQAFGRSAARKHCALAIAGALDPATVHWLAEFRKTVPDAIILEPGYIDCEDLPALYASAQAFLFPSLYEGFGLPIIEAMASGVPVLIGNQGAGPEVANQHAVVVDPYQVDSIAEGIERVTQVSAQALAAARAHAQTFSWDRCARETFAAYHWVTQHPRQA